MSNKGLNKHTLSNYSKKKPKLPRYVKKGYEEHTLLTDKCIRHRKYDKRSGYKLIKNYLETKLGCNWNEVYSELKSKIGNFDCTIPVETKVVIQEDKIYYYFRGGLSELRPESFYVDSEGLLQQVCKTRKTWNKAPEPIVIKLNDNHEYRYLVKSYWDKHGWYYYYKKIKKEVKKKLVVDEAGKPVFYNRLNWQLYNMTDPSLLGTPVFTYETVEKVAWERYPINMFGNYHKLKLRNLGVYM